MFELTLLVGWQQLVDVTLMRRLFRVFGEGRLLMELKKDEEHHLSLR
jgi:hypothetical protein